MKRLALAAALAAAILQAQQPAAIPPAIVPPASSLLQVRRVYVDELVGKEAGSLRELIIAGLDSTRLFVLTDNPDRADAVLKGAADDHVFTDTLDIQEGISARENAGRGSSYSRSSTGSSYGGIGISDTQSHHSKERKHEAYAAVRLCNREGDVLWSTTQESLGGKFRGASADVAAKIAHQLTQDMERARSVALARQ
jgi:hypothetical protein